MPDGNIRKIVIIGAGRLAASLGIMLKEHNFEILQVCNRTALHGQKLAKQTGAEYIREPEQITPLADLYILSVSDDALPGILTRMNIGNRLLVHTSGPVSMHLLDAVSQNTGVIYPLYSFSGKGKPDFGKIPVCLEAGTGQNLERISEFVSNFCNRIYNLSSDDRMRIHLAAVFANNFPNFMIAVADEILAGANICPEIIQPLIRQTTRTMLRKNPFQYQTGPASRNDVNVMEKHLQLLKTHPDYEEIYRQVSAGILNMKKKHD